MTLMASIQRLTRPAGLKDVDEGGDEGSGEGSEEGDFKLFKGFCFKMEKITPALQNHSFLNDYNPIFPYPALQKIEGP